MAHTNTVQMNPSQVEYILSKFPEEYRARLRLYTGEELFYCYRLAQYQPKMVDGLYKSGDVFYMALKRKFFQWLKSECKQHTDDKDKVYTTYWLNGVKVYPIEPAAWVKLGAKFRSSFYGFVYEVSLKPEVIQALANEFNNRRAA